MRGRRFGAALLPFVLLGVLLQGAPAAHATFPGTNGLIAFVSGDFDIYTMNADGTNPAPITQSADKDHSPAWSPDGTKIAFLRCVDPCAGGTNRLRVWVMDADGGNPHQLTTDAASDDYPPAWSPDGTKIAFSTLGNSDPAKNGLFVMNADGSNPTRIDANPSLSPDWSPDGTKLTVNRGADIWVMNADGTNPTNLTNSAASDFQPVWFPDGSKISFTSNLSGQSYDIYTIAPTPGAPTPLFTTNSANEYEPFPSPDGQSIVFETDGAPPGPARPFAPSGFSLVSWALDGLSDGVILTPDGTEPTVATEEPPMAELKLFKEDDRVHPAATLIGTPVTYSVTIENSSDQTALAVQLEDKHFYKIQERANILIEKLNVSQGTCNTNDNQIIRCNIGDILPHATVSLRYQVYFFGPAGIYHDIARAQGSNTGPKTVHDGGLHISGSTCTLKDKPSPGAGSGTPRSPAGARSHVIQGTARPDVICALDGSDKIYAMGGKDTVYAGPGNDIVYGGDAADRLYGQDGNDYLNGGPGADMCVKGPGTGRLVSC